MREPIETPTQPAPRSAGKDLKRNTKAILNRRRAQERPHPVQRRKAWIRRHRLPIDTPRVVLRYIDDLRCRRGDFNVSLVNGHLLLRSGLQISSCLCPVAQHLHRLHHVLGLVVVGIPEVGRPLQVPSHLSQHLRKRCQRLHAWVPACLRISTCNNLLIWRIPLHAPPLVRRYHLRRIGRRSQYLCQQVIGIKCDRSDNLLKFFGIQRVHLL